MSSDFKRKSSKNDDYPDAAQITPDGIEGISRVELTPSELPPSVVAEASRKPRVRISFRPDEYGSSEPPPAGWAAFTIGLFAAGLVGILVYFLRT